MTAIDIQIIAYGLLGLALVYWAMKRRFNRTTIYGTEQFHSYKHKAGAKLVDALLWGLGLGGLVSVALLTFMEHAPIWGFLMLLVAAAYAFENDYFRKACR
jgi:sterol desaturase/sphingolipid hydroxylase (fatty acid hydroxylase superfamily)